MAAHADITAAVAAAVRIDRGAENRNAAELAMTAKWSGGDTIV